MMLHGAADPLVPYMPFDSPGPYFSPGAEATLASWGGYNGCPGDVATEVPKDNYTLHEIDCNGIVSALVELHGVGHHPFYDVGGVVSGTAHYGVMVATTAPFDTTQLAWDFLKTASIVPPPSPPSSPPSANKYCKKLKRLQKWKKQENKWEKKCSA
mmetsp:Transcript_17901/g.44771  ORF Transcript_17901/g.44771 Transcript_17901/m.44771 type:complete len:156 (-) Transcript_17901:139-606(-)